MELSKRCRRGLVLFASSGAVGFFVLVVWHAAVTQKTPENLPLIAAPSGPARVAPEFPGGMQNPNQDLSIYDTFDESNSKVVDNVDPGSGESDTYEAKESSGIKPDTKKLDDVVLPEDIALPEPVKKSKEPELELKEKFFAAQLGAFGTFAAAEEGWKFLSSKHDSTMAGLAPVISAADLGEVGILYRLQTELLGSREHVEEFCQVLRESDADCLVVRP